MIDWYDPPGVKPIPDAEQEETEAGTPPGPTVGAIGQFATELVETPYCELVLPDVLLRDDARGVRSDRGGPHGDHGHQDRGEAQRELPATLARPLDHLPRGFGVRTFVRRRFPGDSEPTPLLVGEVVGTLRRHRDERTVPRYK